MKKQTKMMKRRKTSRRIGKRKEKDRIGGSLGDEDKKGNK
jgi:hypothetical protein